MDLFGAAPWPPQSVWTLAGLDPVDYVDAMWVSPPAARDWTAERWARHVLEGAATVTRCKLLTAWLALGLRVHPLAAGRILGWSIHQRSPSHLVLGAGSRIDTPAEVAFVREGERWWFATFVQLTNRPGRALWAAVAPGHRAAAEELLRDAAARADRDPPRPRRHNRRGAGV